MERLRRIAIDLFLMVAIGACLGLLAPFGSAAMPAGPRLFFWVGFIVAGYLIFRPVSAVAQWVEEETRIPGWLAVLLTALVAALPLAALVGFALGGMTGASLWFGDRFPILYGQVALVGIGIHLLMRLLFPGAAAARLEPVAAGSPAAAQAVPAAERRNPFLDRLPPALGRDLLSLQMQDHYVRAETALGGTLILMRFRDAIAELEGAGLQVHRSWWAAYDAMEELEQDGRAARLRLRGGAALPVSRAFLPAVREALRDRGGEAFDSRPGSYKSRADGGPPPAAEPGMIR